MKERSGFSVRILLSLRSGGMNEQIKTARLNDGTSSQVAGCTMDGAFSYDHAVELFYEPLYRFAFGLTGNVSNSADLTQETYRVLLVKGGQIRDGRKLKSWLFSTLYRRFLGQLRHNTRFPAVQVEEVEWELPAIDPAMDEQADANAVVAALQSLDEKYRAPLALFYLQELSYREIAKALGLPIGTIMSRLARGKEVLRKRLEDHGLGRAVRVNKRPSEASALNGPSKPIITTSLVMHGTFGEMAARN
jgi:RNA polymerase sigma factor (sigma-70 family)